MDNQESLSLTPRTFGFSTQTKLQAPQKTVAQLLDDKDALNDWISNIAKAD
jgi:hypothetical protein